VDDTENEEMKYSNPGLSFEMPPEDNDKRKKETK